MLDTVRAALNDWREFWEFWKTLPKSKPAHLLSDEEIDALPEEAS